MNSRWSAERHIDVQEAKQSSQCIRSGSNMTVRRATKWPELTSTQDIHQHSTEQGISSYMARNRVQFWAGVKGKQTNNGHCSVTGWLTHNTRENAINSAFAFSTFSHQNFRLCLATVPSDYEQEIQPPSCRFPFIWSILSQCRYITCHDWEMKTIVEDAPCMVSGMRERRGCISISPSNQLNCLFHQRTPTASLSFFSLLRQRQSHKMKNRRPFTKRH